jgi:hypothetical protein
MDRCIAHGRVKRSRQLAMLTPEPSIRPAGLARILHTTRRGPALFLFE